MSMFTTILDHYFEPVTFMFNREMAEAFINRKPDPQIVREWSNLVESLMTAR